MLEFASLVNTKSCLSVVYMDRHTCFPTSEICSNKLRGLIKGVNGNNINYMKDAIRKIMDIKSISHMLE